MQTQIIPTYNLLPAKYHFNPSIFRTNQGSMMSYRAITEDKLSHVGICKLTHDLQPERNSAFYVKLPRFRKDNHPEGFEDARVQYINGRLSIAYTTLSPESIWRNLGFSYLDYQFNPTETYYFRYGMTDNTSAVESEQMPSATPGTVLIRHFPVNTEKNWQFFAHEDALHFVYCIEPHTVIRPNLTTMNPDKVYETNYPIPWKYGPPRGGTPPVRIGDEYFSFFHSSDGCPTDVAKIVPCGKIYHFAAYAFSANPPFNITRFSKIPLISGDPYDNVILWGNAAVFPCGAILQGDEWLISYGHNDHTCKLMKISHEEVLASLTG